jgi:hypothetical protein
MTAGHVPAPSGAIVHPPAPAYPASRECSYAGAATFSLPFARIPQGAHGRRRQHAAAGPAPREPCFSPCVVAVLPRCVAYCSPSVPPATDAAGDPSASPDERRPRAPPLRLSRPAPVPTVAAPTMCRTTPPPSLCSTRSSFADPLPPCGPRSTSESAFLPEPVETRAAESRLRSVPRIDHPDMHVPVHLLRIDRHPPPGRRRKLHRVERARFHTTWLSAGSGSTASRSARRR